MRGNFFYKRIGEKILSARKKKAISQEKLAMLADLDRTYISRIEKGKANPTVKVLRKIARALKTKIAVLLQGV